ncbi:uncharacterized protein LACBIDRAFT_312760 [Laccaria bicolor S238N-H82]|uniref:Predicted protein n=1 Tax=Laccaria bicolor (strain S238N-H82 / ATCC MYA-4686) TaxID=486041 RepID=B0DWM2_LACBS|nr:uncharacterized protein LACBIDRAFT_312760 [Laccaria bicolor S238N-H82]EDR01005.1 predicted protein [Laccaria bicolor S238N-H82]|eukprot:XP_001888400.1 predicted protein [Laccaria bicolor S238N-H82]
MKPSRAYIVPNLPHTWTTNEYVRPSLAMVTVPVIDLRAHLLLSFHGDRSKQLVLRQQLPFSLPPAVELYNASLRGGSLGVHIGQRKLDVRLMLESEKRAQASELSTNP